MADDIPMNMQEGTELTQAFQRMAPVLKQFRPPLSEGRESKRSRFQAASDESSDPPIMKILQALTKLSLQLDREAQSLRMQDSFVIFLSSEPQGALQKMIQATAAWKQTVENKTCQRSLKFTLSQAFFTEVQERLRQLNNSAPNAKSLQMAKDKGLITQDGCWPYHRWDNVKQCLVQDKTQPLTVTAMTQMVDELVEYSTQEQWVMQFHAMKGGDMTAHQVVPWRLQVTLRMTDAFRCLLASLTTRSGNW